MESSRQQRWRQLQALFEPGFRRMLLVSFLLHLLLPLIFHLSFFGTDTQRKPPVYRVNLVNKPVKNPQAGRPEATVHKPKPKPQPPPKPKPAPPTPPPIKPQPAAKPIPAKPTPTPAPAKVPAKQPAAQPAGPSKAQETALQQRLEQLRAAQQQKAAEQARKQRLDALRAAAAAESTRVESPIADAPVGMPEGKGDEAGVAAAAFVREYIQQQWSLSKYQVFGNPEAEVVLLYAADGRLLHYRFERKSGNSVFDESLVRAINKSQQLNQPLPEQMEFQITFNLKEMLDR